MKAYNIKDFQTSPHCAPMTITLAKSFVKELKFTQSIIIDHQYHFCQLCSGEGIRQWAKIRFYGIQYCP